MSVSSNKRTAASTGSIDNCAMVSIKLQLFQQAAIVDDTLSNSGSPEY